MPSPVNSPLTQKLRSHLEQIVRERDPYLHPEAHLYVQLYVRQVLEQYGLVQAHEFTIQARKHTNLVLKLPGRQDQSKPIVIGAHYDGVPGSPGADDNASGVAVLLELARLLAQQPGRSPVHLIAFDLEEYGLLGSEAYAEQCLIEREPIRLMLSLEMLGYCCNAPNTQRYPHPLQYIYPNRGDFVALIGNVSTCVDMIRLRRALGQSGQRCCWLPDLWRGQLVRETRLSDHAPFWDRGYPAIMVTDTAFLRNPHYHQKGDRLDTLDLDFMTRICQGLAQGVRAL
jgi:Peptidase family M28